jgi:DNA-binding NarL/FixJ family response regulator
MVSLKVSPPATSWRRQPVRVAVASDQQLVAEAVVAALRNRSFEPLLVRWPPTARDPLAKARRRRAFRRSVGPPPDVGLLLSDLTRMEQVLAAQTIVTGLPLPWLVMAGVARGPAWGALYEGGAKLVVPSDTGLVNVCDLLTDLSSGRKPGEQRRDRRELIQGWRTFASHRSDLTARLQSLTVREEAILQQLHQGFPVRNIAQKSDVTEATVRSQVKAILKKLDVNSQMAAVAAYENVLTDSTTYADAG